MKVFDANFISLALVPHAPVPRDPSSDEPVERPQQRIEELLERLSSQGEKVLLPSPALSEFLVLVGEDGPSYLNEISKSSVFKVADFDERAAIEAAEMTRKALASGDKKGGSTSPWSKIKFDRQIVAIAKVNGADTIYSTDHDVARYGKAVKITVESVWDLPEPQAVQTTLSYDEQEAVEEGQAVAEEPVVEEGTNPAAE